MHDGHDHSHGQPMGENKESDKTKLLLSFTLEHNVQHAAEIKALAERLENESNFEAAKLIREAVAMYESGNDKIHEALHLL